MRKIWVFLLILVALEKLFEQVLSADSLIKPVQRVSSLGAGIAIPEPRCIIPQEADVDLCRDREKEMLAATARLYFRSWVPAASEVGHEKFESIAHATVKDGRYLVTHNHFELPLSLIPDPNYPEIHSFLTITDSQGKGLYAAPLTDFFIAYRDQEIMVLGLRNPKEPRWLESLGFRSAEFTEASGSQLKPGLEIAQVDWDGKHTRVDWSVIDEINMTAKPNKLFLIDAAKRGSSGGGIFFQGVHVANTWTLALRHGEDGRITDIRSTAALNTPELLALP